MKRVDENELRFGDLRGYLQLGRNFSIVTKDGWTSEYFEYKRDIPENYDDMYVYGIGLEDDIEGILKSARYGFVDSRDAKRLRIVVSEKPKV